MKIDFCDETRDGLERERRVREVVSTRALTAGSAKRDEVCWRVSHSLASFLSVSPNLRSQNASSDVGKQLCERKGGKSIPCPIIA